MVISDIICVVQIVKTFRKLMKIHEKQFLQNKTRNKGPSDSSIKKWNSMNSRVTASRIALIRKSLYSSRIFEER